MQTDKTTIKEIKTFYSEIKNLHPNTSTPLKSDRMPHKTNKAFFKGLVNKLNINIEQ